MHIHGLRKLFPAALFIHIVRDVDSVVRSMLNFHRVAGTQLVPNEEEAYKYWLRMVNACLKAERAYGSCKEAFRTSAMLRRDVTGAAADEPWRWSPGEETVCAVPPAPESNRRVAPV